MPHPAEIATGPTPADVFERVAGQRAKDSVRTAPWTSMRGDFRNRGRMQVSPEFRDDLGIRHFRTGNAIFSTPVIGADETVYVGSADHVFYALDPIANAVKWTKDVGEVIDSASTIGEDGSIYVPSGNGLYSFAPDGTERWHLDLLKEESHFSPSTIYWWEGNAVVGPNGWVYAGCDDFHVYAIDPTGKIRWKTLTGCCVWTAACFGPDGTAYLVSFDFHLYAFDMHTGKVKWTRNMKNFVVSSPMLAPDGTLYVASFDRKLYALDPSNGRVRWSMETGGPVYGTPSVDDDGLLYLGSSDGNIYCIDPATRSVRWSYYTGDCVRCSVSLGPDPDGTHPFLAYVGSGTGMLYAFEPDGTCRWSYDTLPAGPERAQYCNINASIALGRHGIATASANGDVVYVPYTVARTHEGVPGFSVRPPSPYPERGSFLYPVSVGGVVSTVTAHAAPIAVAPADTVSLRVVHREAGRTLPAEIDPTSVRATLPAEAPYGVLVTPDGSQVNLLPTRPPEPGRHAVTLAMSYRAGGNVHRFETTFAVEVSPVRAPTPVLGKRFRIEQMSIYVPAIVPSFDQIGIASLAIDVEIVRFDPATGAVIAWGVQKFGIGPDGEPVAGIPVPRSFHFAFGGSYKDGTLVLESKECQFEITAFPVPLDRLRFTASVSDGTIVASSMFTEAKLRSALWRTVKSWLPLPRRGGGGRFVYRFRKIWEMFASWFPEKDRARGAVKLWTAAYRMLPQGFWILAARVWRPWGMVDRTGWYAGLGTFIAAPSRVASHEGLRVESFSYDARRRRLRASFSADPSYARGDACPGILLIDRRTNQPVPLNYSLAQWSTRDKRNVPVRVTLDLPSALDVTVGLDAVLLVDLEERATVAVS